MGKKKPLWIWGLALVGAGVAVGAMLRLAPTETTTAARRGEALGRGVVQLAVIATGTALIIVDLFRRGSGRDGKE